MKIKKLLPGVEIKIYQGADGTWYGGVLLDKQVYPNRDLLPKIGNRPLTDEGSGRWWYDPHQSLHSYQYESPRQLIHYTPAEARAMLDREIAYLLIEIAQVRIEDQLEQYVAGVEHKEHWNWQGRQDQRRQSHLRSGLPEKRLERSIT